MLVSADTGTDSEGDDKVVTSESAPYWTSTVAYSLQHTGQL